MSGMSGDGDPAKRVRCDVGPEEYAGIIRQMIRHEDDVTNHRIMWLLVGQGFLANAFISPQIKGVEVYIVLSLAGILVTISAFAMLYYSYQARGYLKYLGKRAKAGELREEFLPLIGWPDHRTPGWRKNEWAFSWFRHVGDLLEPWFYMPGLFICLWLLVLLAQLTTMNQATLVLLALVITAMILLGSCAVLSGTDDRDKDEVKVR